MQAGVRLHVSRRACVKQAVSWRVQYVILFKSTCGDATFGACIEGLRSKCLFMSLYTLAPHSNSSGFIILGTWAVKP